MPKSIEYHQGARDDFDESFDWYAKRSRSAAVSFATAVDDTLLKISADPDRFPPTLCKCRHAALKRFPFRIVFRDEPDRLVVVAVSHAKRQPGYWRDRT
jgi:toxin ParE1/3/4